MVSRTAVFLMAMVLPLLFTVAIWVTAPSSGEDEGIGIGRGKGRHLSSSEAEESESSLSLENSQYMDLGSILGYSAYFSLLLSSILGFPGVQVWLSKLTRNLAKRVHSFGVLSRKDVINLHIDTSVATLVLSYVHFLVLALTKRWNKYFDITLIYPKIFHPITEFWSTNLALTLGTWGFFSMAGLSLASYYRKSLYRSIGRKWFLRLKDVLMLVLVGIVFHTLILGKLTEQQNAAYWIVVLTGSVTFALWIILGIKNYLPRHFLSKSRIGKKSHN